MTVDIDKLNFSISDMERQLKNMDGEKQENEKKIQRLRGSSKPRRRDHQDREEPAPGFSGPGRIKSIERRPEEESSRDRQGTADDKRQSHNQNRGLANLKIEKRTEERYKELKNPIVLAELNAFEQKRGELNNQIITIEAELKNFDTQMSEILKRDKENSGKILKDLDKEESNFKQEIKTLDSEIGNYESREGERAEQSSSTRRAKNNSTAGTS